MDNIALNGLPIDLMPNNLSLYQTVRTLDNGVHPYMHNIMTLRTLGLDSYWATKRELRHYFKKPTIEIVQSMRNPTTFNDEYIVQYVKRYK